MLPSPTLSFTLSSLHDETRLDCRIYHPECLTDQTFDPASRSNRGSLSIIVNRNNDLNCNETRLWGKQAAVVAHPYAPLGGSYDDPVVDVVAGTLLQVGFVVATFNFRGAHSSAGRTSWTSKPERTDYMSVAGFLAYYVHYLDPPHSPGPNAITSAPPVLLLAGYSYGATITTRLPPLEEILSHFASPVVHTAAADIRLRAQHLAEQQNSLASAPLSPRSPRRSLGVRVGGEEDILPTSSRRPRSRSYAREERIRKGVKDILSRSRIIHRRRRRKLSGQDEEVEHVERCMERIESFTAFRSAYILVSLPLGIFTSLMTMSFSSPFSSWSRRPHKTRHAATQDHSSAAEGREVLGEDDKFATNPTLSIYGDQDGFLALKKMRDWTAHLATLKDSSFRYVEVSGAGHFWMEEGVIFDLRDAIGAFSVGILSDSTMTRANHQHT